MFTQYPDLLTIPDIQSALGIGRSTAYRLIRDGRLRHLRIGKTIKVPKLCLIDFARNSCYTIGAADSLPSREALTK